MRNKSYILVITFSLLFILRVFAQEKVYDALGNGEKTTFIVNGSKYNLLFHSVEDINSNWHGISFYWMVIPNERSYLNVEGVEKRGRISTIFQEISTRNSIAIISGGFYKINDKPEGLVISEGRKTSSYKSWNQGGFFIQIKPGEYTILPYNRYQYLDFDLISSAIQSKPIIIVDGENDILPSSKGRSNRIGIGTTKNGDLLVAIMYNNRSNAATLYEFAETIKRITNNYDIRCEEFLALDGGPNVNLYLPNIKKHIGPNPNRYNAFIPNVIHVKSK